MDANISPKLWSDPDFEALDAQAKLSFMWILTNPQRDIAGFTEISQRRFEFETGLEFEALRRACQGLTKGLIDLGEGLYWARNFVGYQLGRGNKLSRNNIAKSVIRRVDKMDQTYRDLFYAEYPELVLKASKESEDSEALSKPLARGCQGEQEQEQEQELSLEQAVLKSNARAPISLNPELDRIKRNIQNLKEEWAMPNWTPNEERDLLESLGSFTPLTGGDWELLESYLNSKSTKPDGKAWWRPETRSRFIPAINDIITHARTWRK